MRRFTVISLTAISLCFSSSIQAERKPLIVTGSSTWKPFSYINEQGQPDGIMVDYWRLYGEKNKIDVEFHLKPWSESLDYASNTPDVIHGGLGYTSERASELVFSHELPLKRYDVYLFVRKELPFDDLNFLESAIVGTVNQSTKHEFLNAHVPEQNTRIFPTFGSLNMAAYRGEIDVFIDDLSSAMYDMRSTGHVGLFTPRRKLYSFPLHFAINKQQKHKLSALEKGVAKIDRKDVQAIYEKWFADTELQKAVTSISRSTKQIVFTVILLLLFCGLILYRKRFQQRLAELKSTISALNDSNEKLQVIMQNDPVTGSKTRHQFFTKLSELRFSPSPYVVTVLGIEHLKFINENYGQDVGDMALKHLATQLRLLLSSNTTVARLGGGEFAILFEFSDQSQTIKRMQKLKIARQIKSLYIDQQMIPIEFCYGLACYPNDSNDSEELVRIATMKMRLNKHKTAFKAPPDNYTDYPSARSA